MQELSKSKTMNTEKMFSSEFKRGEEKKNSPNGCHFTVIEIQGTDKHHQHNQHIRLQHLKLKLQVVLQKNYGPINFM